MASEFKEQVCTENRMPRGMIANAGCRVISCHSWRNATCTNDMCVCAPGQCIIDGACVNQGDTSKVTGGTCNAMQCNGFRNAQCLGGACVCSEDMSAVGGECVPKKSGCPRFTGTSCHDYSIDKIMHGECSAGGKCSKAGYCECAENECAQGNTCKPKTAEVIALSIAEAKARSSQATSPLPFFAIALLSLSALVVVARRAQMNQQIDTTENYVQVA